LPSKKLIIGVAAGSGSAFAYRPFNGTYAAVAEPGNWKSNCSRRAFGKSRGRKP
jgi:hypothetical protein